MTGKFKHVVSCHVEFKPAPDISPFELAQCVALLTNPKVYTAQQRSDIIDQLPPAVRRHFDVKVTEKFLDHPPFVMPDLSWVVPYNFDASHSEAQ